MAVSEVPTKFETSDGQEFSDRQEAERHEEAVTANREFEEARAKLGRLLARREKTADGREFDFCRFGDYWYVSEGWTGLPALSRVSFYVWDCEFDPRADGFVIVQRDRASSNDGRREYRIRDLYWSERAAEVALLAAQEAWLAKRAEEVAKLRARVVPEADE